MTDQEALVRLEKRCSHCRQGHEDAPSLGRPKCEDCSWALAISALRERMERSKPLTLEELQHMDGQPVWIVEHPEWGHWELSEDAEDYIVDREEAFYGMTCPWKMDCRNIGKCGPYGLHKLGWLAYRFPPPSDPEK